MRSDRPYLLLYDGECSLCVGFSKAVRRWDRRKRIDLVPFDDPRVRSIAPGMSEETLRRSFHLAFPDGRIRSGSQAMPDLLSLLPGWKTVGWLLRHLPGALWLSEQLYAWIAWAPAPMRTPLPAYQFYPAARRCPSCGGKLVSSTPIIRRFLQGPLQGMGIACYCVNCNVRYRATSRLRYGRVSWLGPIGRWIWWQTTEMEVTLRPENG